MMMMMMMMIMIIITGAAARARDGAQDDRGPREGARDPEQESCEGRERDAAAGEPSERNLAVEIKLNHRGVDGRWTCSRSTRTRSAISRSRSMHSGRARRARRAHAISSDLIRSDHISSDLIPAHPIPSDPKKLMVEKTRYAPALYGHRLPNMAIGAHDQEADGREDAICGRVGGGAAPLPRGHGGGGAMNYLMNRLMNRLMNCLMNRLMNRLMK